jgi:hypothetical protein
MTAPDISDITKTRGVDAARAFLDGAKKYEPPPEADKLPGDKLERSAGAIPLSFFDELGDKPTPKDNIIKA